MKRCLVTGAGGFIGHHLVRRLKAEGFYVTGVDIKRPEFGPSDADEFYDFDLRKEDDCGFMMEGSDYDHVYSLAACMGGMGFIHSAECEIMRDSALININMIDAAARAGVKRYFLSSSECIYPDMPVGAPTVREEDAYPAMPDNEYGWEKLYAERMALAYGRRFGIPIRIARFGNCYGPEGTWRGGREKAPAAICRKVAEAADGSDIEIWGDGSAVRSYTYVDDLVDGIFRLMNSDIDTPANIDCREYVTVRQLVETVAAVAGKKIGIKSVPGPVGVQSRNFSNDRIRSTGWEPKHTLRQGIEKTYPWVEKQVKSVNNFR